MLQHLANAALGPMGCLKHGGHVVELADDHIHDRLRLRVTQFTTSALHQNGSSIGASEPEAYNTHMPSSRATRRVDQDMPRDAGNSLPMGGTS